MMQLRKATRSRQHLRICLCSPSGGGKTFTALRLAHTLGGPVGVIDTENGSAELYAGEANPDGGRFEFSTIDLAQEPGKFSVDNYVKALRCMAQAGMRTVIVDSGSHAWAGPGGVLEFVDEVARRGKSGNKFNAWAEGTPKHNEFLQALLAYPGHLIVTLRTKVEYVQEQVNGRTQIRKVGMAPIQREGLEYEMTLVGDLEADTHRLIITKSRCSALADRSFDRPGADMARVLLRWLDDASDPEPASSPPRASRGAPQPIQGVGGPVTTAGSSSLSPGPAEDAHQLVSACEGPSGPGDSPIADARASMLASVKRYQASHPAIVKEEAQSLGLSSMNKSTEEQIATLLDAVIERIERSAIQDEGTQPEGVRP